MEEFKLPELGDGITGGTIVSIAYSEGDIIATEETLIEVETDKAVLPVPCTLEGKIEKFFVKEGDEIQVGDVICNLSISEKNSKESDESNGQLNNEPANKLENETSTAEIKKETSSTLPKKEKQQELSKGNSSDKPLPKIFPQEIIAGPATRKLARELEVDLGLISGSGSHGRIFVEDVKEYVKNTLKNNQNGSTTIKAKPLPDFSTFGAITKEPLTKLRKTIADQMDYCWRTIPHVHQFHEIDVTEIVAMQKKYGGKFKEKGSAVSVTLFIIKALAQCIEEFPIFNSSYDSIHQEVIYKKYYNIGVAVDTPSGLIVPVLKDIDKKSIFEIGKELKEIAKKTRERTITPKDLQGGCITLSNLGGIGGTHFTPIINSPEVAIVGVGRNRIQAIYEEDQFVPRSILPLCLAYDHRVIDGAVGARFIVRLEELLKDSQIMLMGYEN